MIKMLAALAAAGALAACSTTSPDVVSRSEAQQLSSVITGTVESVRTVSVEGNQTGLGATVGAVAGAAAGSSVGGRREQVAVGTLAAVLGGVLGHAIERGATREQAREIIVRLAGGERVAIVQATGSESLNPGDIVTIVQAGGRARVTRAEPAAAARTL